MPGGLSMPYDVGNVSRGVVKGRCLDPLVMRGGKKGVAGAEARAYDAKPTIALGLKPIQAATNIDYSLTAGVKRPSYVCRDSVIGAQNLRRRSNIMVGHAQPQNGDPQKI